VVDFSSGDRPLGLLVDDHQIVIGKFAHLHQQRLAGRPRSPAPGAPRCLGGRGAAPPVGGSGS
jgi:hypothetical protein